MDFIQQNALKKDFQNAEPMHYTKIMLLLAQIECLFDGIGKIHPRTNMIITPNSTSLENLNPLL